MSRFASALLLSTLLGGCVAIPPAVVGVSYAADGVSYLFSGKSVSDHAISEIADEDCALWRLLTLERPCRTYEAADEFDGTMSDDAVASDPKAPDNEVSEASRLAPQSGAAKPPSPAAFDRSIGFESSLEPALGRNDRRWSGVRPAISFSR